MIAIGQIRKSVGVKGEMRVVPFGGDPGRFVGLSEIWVGKEESTARSGFLASVRIHDSDAVVRIEGVDSRSESDRLRGQYLFVKDSSAVAPSDGSYFVHEIIGMQVVTDDGTAVGAIGDVLTLPSGDVWSVTCKGKEVLIPAMKEFIRSVDRVKREVTIRTIEGLLD